MILDPKDVDWNTAEMQYKDLLRREERGELTGEESAKWNEIAERQGQPLHASLWCLCNIVSHIAQQREREAGLGKVQSENAVPKERCDNKASSVADDSGHPEKNYCLTDEEMAELTGAPEGQVIPFFDKLWLRRYRASKQAEQKTYMTGMGEGRKGRGRDGAEPNEQEAGSVASSVEEMEIMKKAAQRCGQTLPDYLASLLVSTLGLSGLKLEADSPTRNEKQRVTHKKRMDVTQKDAAQICGRSISTIKKWERGESTPEGWPGRADSVALRAFAYTRGSKNSTKKAIKNAARVGDMDKMSRHVAR